MGGIETTFGTTVSALGLRPRSEEEHAEKEEDEDEGEDEDEDEDENVDEDEDDLALALPGTFARSETLPLLPLGILRRRDFMQHL